MLLVRVDVKSEQKEAFLSAVADVMDTTRKNEPGAVIRFDVIQDSSDPNRLVVYEVWRDRAAFDAHSRTLHYRRFGDLTKDWLVAPPTVLFVGWTVFLLDVDDQWQSC